MESVQTQSLHGFGSADEVSAGEDPWTYLRILELWTGSELAAAFGAQARMWSSRGRIPPAAWGKVRTEAARRGFALPGGAFEKAEMDYQSRRISEKAQPTLGLCGGGS